MVMMAGKMLGSDLLVEISACTVSKTPEIIGPTRVQYCHMKLVLRDGWPSQLAALTANGASISGICSAPLLTCYIRSRVYFGYF